MKQYKLGVTGEIGAGKSFFSKTISEISIQNNVETQYLSADVIGKELLSDDFEYLDIRKEIAEKFKLELENDTSINLNCLRDKIFKNNQTINHYNSIVKKPLENLIEHKINNFNGDFTIFESALLIESKRLDLVDYNVAYIKINKKEQIKRLTQRNISTKKLVKRKQFQFSNDEKLEKLKLINRLYNSDLYTLDTSNLPTKQVYKNIFNQIRKNGGF